MVSIPNKGREISARYHIDIMAFLLAKKKDSLLFQKETKCRGKKRR